MELHKLAVTCAHFWSIYMTALLRPYLISGMSLEAAMESKSMSATPAKSWTLSPWRTLICGQRQQRKTKRQVQLNLDRTVATREEKFLPPGTMKEFWEQYRAQSTLQKPASFTCFWRAACRLFFGNQWLLGLLFYSGLAARLRFGLQSLLFCRFGQLRSMPNAAHAFGTATW